MGARGIGAVAAIEPGVEVWSRERLHVEHGETLPVGGIVVAKTETLDQDTGAFEPAFVVIDHTRIRPRVRWAVLREDEIDRQTVQVADVGQIVKLWRGLAEHVAFRERWKERRGPATAEEARLVQAAHLLIGLVFGPEGLLHGVLAPPAPQEPTESRPVAPVDVASFVD